MNSSTRTTADVLRQAADYIARHGFHFPADIWDNYGPSADPNNPTASATGAITIAAYGHPVVVPIADGSGEYTAYVRAEDAYRDWFEHVDHPADLDEPTTAAEAINELRASAALWGVNNRGVAS